MPPAFWDYIHLSRSRTHNDDDDEEDQAHHNLQEGLFQIASQTCNILVQVNNTNNINLGSNFQYDKSTDFSQASTSTSRSTRKTTFFDIEQSVVLLQPKPNKLSQPSTPSRGRFQRLSEYKRRLSVKADADFRYGNIFRNIMRFPTVEWCDMMENMDSNPAFKLMLGTFRDSVPQLFHECPYETVLESSSRDPVQAPVGDDDFELWDHSQMLRNQHRYKWNHGSGGICKPSCIPIMFILVLIILVVLLPLLDSQNDKLTGRINSTLVGWNCYDECNIQLVESIPEGLVYEPGSPSFMSTFDAWNVLIDDAKKTLFIGSFYWTLKSDEVYNHSSSIYGDKIFNALLNAGTVRKIDIRIAQNMPSQTSPNIDTEILQKRKAAKIRSVNFMKLFGAGVLHTKVWVVDGQHFYVGSANMDWRSLSQVKELGVLVTNCSCLAKDLTKIFNVYWELGRNDSHIPPRWPDKFTTAVNIDKPMLVNYNGGDYLFSSFFSSSPPPMNPRGRTNDLGAILHTIENAERFIHISVMDYFPLELYSPKIKYWPDIDTALRTAAIDNKVSIKLLISYWNHSRPSEDFFLKSLSALSESYKGVDIQVKRFIVPATDDQKKIPFGRVNHNKYMVTDQVAYIGTSNWSGDYFIDTAGIGFVSQDTVHDRNDNVTTLRSQLASVFERDWNSKYAVYQEKFEN